MKSLLKAKIFLKPLIKSGAIRAPVLHLIMPFQMKSNEFGSRSFLDNEFYHARSLMNRMQSPFGSHFDSTAIASRPFRNAYIDDNFRIGDNFSPNLHRAVGESFNCNSQFSIPSYMRLYTECNINRCLKLDNTCDGQIPIRNYNNIDSGSLETFSPSMSRSERFRLLDAYRDDSPKMDFRSQWSDENRSNKLNNELNEEILNDHQNRKDDFDRDDIKRINLRMNMFIDNDPNRSDLSDADNLKIIKPTEY
ncbi:T-complex protein 1 [Sarcoptes scabiei]|nr:T-complex protein 1 [Sarcoptes scabiei]